MIQFGNNNNYRITTWKWAVRQLCDNSISIVPLQDVGLWNVHNKELLTSFGKLCSFVYLFKSDYAFEDICFLQVRTIFGKCHNNPAPNKIYRVEIGIGSISQYIPYIMWGQHLFMIIDNHNYYNISFKSLCTIPVVLHFPFLFTDTKALNTWRLNLWCWWT